MGETVARRSLSLSKWSMKEFRKLSTEAKRTTFRREVEQEKSLLEKQRDQIRTLILQGASLNSEGRVVFARKMNCTIVDSEMQFFVDLWAQMAEEIRIEKWAREVKRKGTSRDKKKLEEFLEEEKRKKEQETKPLPAHWDEVFYAIGHCAIETLIEDGITLTADGKHFLNIPRDDPLWPIKDDEDFINFYKRDLELVKKNKKEREEKEALEEAQLRGMEKRLENDLKASLPPSVAHQLKRMEQFGWEVEHELVAAGQNPSTSDIDRALDMDIEELIRKSQIAAINPQPTPVKRNKIKRTPNKKL